jgi:hypothetical protein
MLSMGITLALMASIFINNLVENRSFKGYQIPLIIGIAATVIFLFFSYREEHFIHLYYLSNIATIVNVAIIIIYTGLRGK